jgi:glycogen operon protein
MRKKHPVFHRRNYFEGESLRPGGRKDVLWFTPKGEEMTDEEWNQSFAKCIAMEFNGSDIREWDEKRKLLSDDNFIWVMNASDDAIEFNFPRHFHKSCWHLIVDTSTEPSVKDVPLKVEQNFTIQPHTTLLLQQMKE